jgi:hypothetical protein
MFRAGAAAVMMCVCAGGAALAADVANPQEADDLVAFLESYK